MSCHSSFDVLGLTFDELRGLLNPRTHQVKALRAAYRTLVMGGAESNPAALAAASPFLSQMRADILPVIRHVQDGELIKFIQRTPDQLEIESVLVPMQRRGQSWNTLCVSSQIGCARGCEFCETAQLGLLRNLTASEIVGQLTEARRHFRAEVRNIVFMGMGEPLDNITNVFQAVRILNDRNGISLGAERIKISTVGRIDGIQRLAEQGWRRITLAVSLNAPNDEIRSRIMPINRLDPMGPLRDALQKYITRNCQYLMMEYVLIPTVNDQPSHARELAEYLRPLPCVVNVIPYNPRRESPWPAATPEAASAFLNALTEAGAIAKLRITKGQTQMAACGQLGNREQRKPKAMNGRGLDGARPL